MEEKSTWARLRWPIKAIIIALPILAIGYWAMQSGKFDANPTVQTDSTSHKNADSNHSSGSKDTRSFNYQPEKPVDGEYKGVVEVGASGFQRFWKIFCL